MPWLLFNKLWGFFGRKLGNVLGNMGFLVWMTYFLVVWKICKLFNITSCSFPRELSNAMSHSSGRRRNHIDSWLLVVGSQTASLTLCNLCKGCNLCQFPKGRGKVCPFPNWRGTSFARNLVGWGTPSAKCTSMGALSSSKGNSILLALSCVMKLWEAPMSKRHNTSHLETFPFKKIRRLHSPWARLAARALTLEAPLPDLGLGQSLE